MTSACPEDDRRPVVAMVRAPVFNASETFVRRQILGLERYRAIVTGLEDKGNVPDGICPILPESGFEALGARLLGHWGSIARKLQGADVRLVHAQFGTDGVLALPLARRLGVPLVTTLRGYEVTRTRANLLVSLRPTWMRYALAERELARRGALFLAVSDALRAKAIARGFPPERTLTHYNGIDLAYFRPEGRPREAIVLHVARLIEKKGTAVLLRAFALTCGSSAIGELVVLGDGPLRPKLERQAAALGIAGRVRFLGHRSPDEVRDWLQRAALLAVPSLTAASGDSEGLPNAAVEALAVGLPVVGTDHAGLPEAIADGVNGFLSPEGDAEHLALRITELLHSPDLRRGMGLAGRARAEERFNAAHQNRLLETRYDAVCAEFPRTRTSEVR